MSIAREHAEWLRLVEPSGPFVSIPVLMRVFPQGLDPVEPEIVGELRRAHDEWEESQEGRHPDPALHTAWVRFVLERVLNLPPELLLEGPALPPHLRVTVAEHGETLLPDLALVNPPGREPAVRLIVQRYPAGQHLERIISGSHWGASPVACMVALLRGSNVPLGLVTNGEQWMLVNVLKELTTGSASWYATLWQEEPLTLRAFRSLLGTQRFFGVPDSDTLEEMLRESANNQQEVTDQLGYQVRRAVEVLIQAIDRVDKDRNRALLKDQRPEDLYNAALTVMMRLVFLFSAEERGLLPLTEDIYSRNYAVSPLGAQLREAAGVIGEEVLERKHDAWARLLATFRAVHDGVRHEDLQLRAYGGHLFDPDRYPFLEGRTPGTKWRQTPAEPLPIDNRNVLHLLEALQLLQVALPGGGPAEVQQLSFKALDIEQIGHVYEGLLDHTALRADAPVLGLDGKRDAVSEVALVEIEAQAAKGEDALIAFVQERTGRMPNAIRKLLEQPLDTRDQQRLFTACDNDADLYARVLPYAGLLRTNFSGYPVVYTPGSVYVTIGSDRRSTGTHYTPRSLTEPIVKHTLDPLCYFGPAEGRPKNEWRLRSAADLLKLKICDMAMGSGAFLVQSARYLSDRLLEAWDDAEAAYRANGYELPVQMTPEGMLSDQPSTDTILEADLEARRTQALRIICDRCLYGVDKNEVAVEMAKLSLWLVTLAKDLPFTFLDHTLRCGDSLLGTYDVKQLKQWTLQPEDGGAIRQESFIEPVVARAVADALRLRRKIEEHPTLDASDLEEKARLLEWAERALDLVKLGADLLVGSALASDTKERERLRQDTLAWYHLVVTTQEHQRTVRVSESEREEARQELARLRARADDLLGGQRPFHWPLEFPEVFLGAQRDGEERGFSSVAGNPPFLGGTRISTELGTSYLNVLQNMYPSFHSRADICALFYLRAFALLAVGGCFGLVATNTISEGDTEQAGLRQIVSNGGTVYRAVDTMPWPGSAAVSVSVVNVHKGAWGGKRYLDGQEVEFISTKLDAINLKHRAVPLRSNRGLVFEGSKLDGIGFVISTDEARRLMQVEPQCVDVVLPYLSGSDLNDSPTHTPERYVINFGERDLSEAEQYPHCLAIVRERVFPERQKHSEARTRENWWLFQRPRPNLYASIADHPRTLVKVRHSHAHAFAFVPIHNVFSDGLVVFAFADFGYLALLQSSIHESWALNNGSTLGSAPRYTPSDCFETFPFPDDISGLDNIGEHYHTHRQSIMLARQEGLTKTYNRFHVPQESADDIERLRALHVEMDYAVARAYGWDDLDLGHGFHQTRQGLRYTISEAARREVLGRLLRLNHERHAEEVAAGLVDEKGKPLRKNGNGGKNGRATRAASGETRRAEEMTALHLFREE